MTPAEDLVVGPDVPIPGRVRPLRKEHPGDELKEEERRECGGQREGDVRELSKERHPSVTGQERGARPRGGYPPEMPRVRMPLVVLTVSGVLLVASLWLLRTSPGAQARREADRRRAELEAASPQEPARVPPVLTVEAVTAWPVEARTVVERTSVLSAVRQVVVGAEVAGRVVEVLTEEHAPVARGDVLVRLDTELPGAAVARARAALLRAEAAQRLAVAELRRQRELSSQGVSSAAELERVESEERTAEAAVAEARAALLDAETRLRKTAIAAPFGAVVSALDLEPGAYLRPGDPVAELADLSELEIEVAVSDEEILALREGDRVELRVDALPGGRFEGRVGRPGRTADARTRKYPVPVRVANDDAELLPGMLGTVRFELGDARPVLRLQRRALQREFDLDYLYVLEETGEADGVATARRRRVVIQPVAFHPELVEVSEGLEMGERVALSGLRQLRDGLRVRVRPDAARPGSGR